MDVSISVNDVYKDLGSGLSYRILWISADYSETYVIQLDGDGGMPFERTVGNILAAFDEGFAQSIEDPFAPIAEVDEKQREKRDYWWLIVGDSLQNEPDIFDIHKRSAIFKSLSEEHGVGVSTLYRIAKKYWKRGKTQNSICADYGACGGRGRPRLKAAPGKKRSETSTYGKNLTDADYAHFNAVIRKYYLNKSSPKMTEAYEKLVTLYYSKKNDDGEIEMLPAGQVPSLRQMRYWFNHHYSEKEASQKRKGKTEFELTGRSTTGKEDFGLLGPGSEFQVDATIGDIYLLSQFDRNDIIGRPVIYFVMQMRGEDA